MNLITGREQPYPRASNSPLLCTGIAALLWTGVLAVLLLQPPAIHAQNPPSTNQYIVKDRYTLRSFPHVSSADEWRERAKEIREQILVSCGLWPIPNKAPLKAQVFEKVERDGYSVEKVIFQTWPGFYLAGNLYRPLGKGNGPFPAMLCPHGHWARGRLTDTNVASIPARCITFARNGIIAFSYDMVDCLDTRFADTPSNPKPYDFHKEFGTKPSDQLWNISLLGVQTWNSIRALDFLESFLDVDKSRMGCNGASSGGTQTFMLGAVDDRLALQSPACMVSHSMQGGGVCENAPGLRVEYSNMEIAAAPAPRPQLLVGASGDWTRATMTVEGPAIRRVYELLGAGSQLQFPLFEAPHNFNAASRGAVYDWLGKALLKDQSIKEEPYQKVTESDSLVFSKDNFPSDALTKAQFVESLKQMHRANWEALVPTNHTGLSRFKDIVGTMWSRTMVLPPAALTPIQNVPPRFYTPIFPSNTVVVLVHPDGKSAYSNGGSNVGLAKSFADKGFEVSLPELFPIGQRADTEFAKRRNYFTNHFTAYNRTDIQERVREIVEICVSLRVRTPEKRIVLCGEGRAGLWALMAAPMADAVVADCANLDVSSDEVLLERDLFCPGMRNMGGFEGAAMLSAPNPLLLHNTHPGFETKNIRSAYEAVWQSAKCQIEKGRLDDDTIVRLVSRM